MSFFRSRVRVDSLPKTAAPVRFSGLGSDTGPDSLPADQALARQLSSTPPSVVALAGRYATAC
jgi:hypothetical protein